MRLLVSGKEGQVVRSLAWRAQHSGFAFDSIGRPEMDMARPETVHSAVTSAIRACKPSIVVNVAAYTAVDQAEDEPHIAEAVNNASAGEIARAAAEAGLPIIHLSTDYVFDGLKSEPYSEADQPNPKTSYGRSKLRGEYAVAIANPQHVILRTAWVYSPFGKNFVKTMLRLAETRNEISVVADQFGNPTSAFDIVEAIVLAAKQLESGSGSNWGCYHFSGTSSMNWASFAQAIFNLAASMGAASAVVKPIVTADYPTKAARPANSRLDCSRFLGAFGALETDFDRSLEFVLRRLLAN